MNNGTDPLDAECVFCHIRLGDHTLREHRDCLQNTDYQLPYEEIPGGPLTFPGIDGDMVGEVTIGAGYIDTDVAGRVPVIRFVFTGPGPTPGEHRSLRPINLVMDAQALKSVRQMFSTVVDKAITAARRGR